MPSIRPDFHGRLSLMTSSRMRLCLLMPALAIAAAFSNSAHAQWDSQPAQEGWGSSQQQPYQSPPVTASPVPNSEGGLALRLSTLENQIRDLNGKVEQLEFKNRTLEDQLKKFQDDAEYRFQAVEGGKKNPPPAPKRDKRSEAVLPPLPASADSTDDDLSVSPVPVTQSANAQRQLGAPPQPLGQLAVDEQGAPVELNPGTVTKPLEPLPGAINEEARPGYMPRTQQNVASLSPPSDDPKDQYDLAYGYMLRGDYEMAETSFKKFLSEHPSDANSAQAAYWLGESQYQRKQYKTAAESFLKVYNDHPTAPKAPESLLRLGMSLKALGQKDAACASYSEVIRKYPKAVSAVKKRVQTEQKSAGC